MKKSIALIFAASILFMAGCCTTHQEHAATKWEYKIMHYSPFTPSNANLTVEQTLAELGGKGWELVSWNNATYIFKRPIR